MTEQQMAVLVEVCDMGPVTALAIAEGIGVPRRSVDRSLARLQSDRLVSCDKYQLKAAKWLATDAGEQVRENASDA
jgi:predicted ArsR family transcriptional regulator